ncbi:MAG: hypothetical protein QOD92_171 [Acidimicrobiaceae bacterium]|jgi:hypothetical protein
MEADANLVEYGRVLADAIEVAIPTWVVRSIEGRWRDWTGGDAGAELLEAARVAGEQAGAEVGSAVRALLVLDVDEQRVNPLALVRRAVIYPTAVLRDAGVPPVVRDEFDERAFPDDIYALVPASFADVDPELHEPGLLWGAAKAHAHLARRRGDPF